LNPIRPHEQYGKDTSGDEGEQERGEKREMLRPSDVAVNENAEGNEEEYLNPKEIPVPPAPTSE